MQIPFLHQLALQAQTYSIIIRLRMFMQTHIFINIAKGTERKRRHVSYIKYYSEDYICICYTWYVLYSFPYYVHYCIF